MYYTVFVQSWLKLGGKGQKRFHKFVKSPYFNSNPILIKALDTVESVAQKAWPSFQKEDFHQALYPQAPYQDKPIRYLLSDLLALLKQFLRIEYPADDSIKQSLEMGKVLRDKGMNRLYEKEWKGLARRIESPPYQNEAFHYQRYLYNFEQQDHLSNKSRKGYPYLEQAVFDLQAHFIATSLKLACLNAGPQAMEQGYIDPVLLRLLLQRVEEGQYEESPAVMIYYYAYQMLFSQESTYFFQLAQWLEDNWNLFPASETQDIYLMGVNYCVSTINQGDHSYIEHAFNLYKSGLDKAVFLEDGYLSIYNYKNILRLGISLKAYDWVESFMERFKDWLPKDERENTYLYNLAYYYYRKPDYDKTLELLRHVKFKDVYNNLDARRMLLRIYYELEEWDALDSHLDSFKSFVLRQKQIGYHRPANLNLIKIVRLLLKKGVVDKKAREQIRQRINGAGQLAEKDWLLGLLG